MIDYEPLFQHIADPSFAAWLERLPGQIDGAINQSGNGHLPTWKTILQELPRLRPSSIDLDAATVRFGEADDGDDQTRAALEVLLRGLHPWRKGPFEVFGIGIDTEWRSDWKWDRLQGHIQPLQGRKVLDVGCGNGYHCWRMAGAGAELVVGLDPFLLYVIQYQALRVYAGDLPVFVLPLGIEDLPPGLGAFDTVFSMGVLYHRRSPFDHLLELRDCLKSGGELVLETLVVAGPAGHVLVPEGRYAKMRNVWFLPSCPTLEGWLKRSGFRDIRLIDVTPTTIEEQRSTDWMTFESLPDFLDRDDRSRTVEGLPAPVRAVFSATRP